MQCKHCGSEWNAGQSIVQPKNCPFCGASLTQKRELDSVDAVLAEIIDQFGIEMLADGKRMVALFADLAPGMMRERRMLQYLVESDGHTMLLHARTSNASEQKLVMERTIGKLKDEMLVSDRIARTICQSFWKSIAEPGEEPEMMPPAVPTSISQTTPASLPVAGMENNAVSEHTDGQTLESDFVIEDGVLKAYRGSAPQVHIPAEVTVIGEHAFAKNPHIRSVFLGNGVRMIRAYAFAQCANLQEIQLPESLEAILGYAFAECGQLHNLQLPSNLQRLESGAFKLCSGITSVVIPGGVWTLGPLVFCGCKGLEKVTIEDGVRVLGAEAFSGCAALRVIEIPDSVIRVFDNVFAQCGALQQIRASDMWNVRFQSSLPAGCIQHIVLAQPEAKTTRETVPVTKTNEKDFVIQDNELTKYRGRDSVVHIPEGVEIIGQEAFQGNSYIQTVFFPASLTKVGYFSFAECPALKEICWGNSQVQEIAGFAFSKCKSLTSVVVPESVKIMGYCVFQMCEHLKTVQLPQGLEIIGSGVFEDCSELEEITVPGSVKEIYTQTFRRCYNLQRVVLEDGVETLNWHSFVYCTSLKKMSIPDSVKSVKWGAFNNCWELTDIEASQAWKRIWEHRLPHSAR